MSKHNDKGEISRLYDEKTRSLRELNALLASTDKRFFNHNGLLLPGESHEPPQSEEDLLGLIHRLETKLVDFGLEHLGPVPKGGRVLDAGCGGGGGSLMIHEKFGCFVESITLSSEQAKFGTNAAEFYGFSEWINFSVGDMLDLTRGEHHYDAIWACESTEHVDDLERMFSGFARMIKPSGRLVVIAWCASASEEGLRLKETVDKHYKTDIHLAEAYPHAAAVAGWRMTAQVDLTEMTAAYWKIRAGSKHRTGAESFMVDGFASRNITYYLFSFVPGR